MASWATFFVSLAVAIIAFMQWRTAHQKMLLDLFEKRLAVYEQVRQSVSRIVTTGKVSPESDQALLEAMNASTFLFGEDVYGYLERLWLTMTDFQLYEGMVSRGTADENSARQRSLNFRKLNDFYREGPQVFARYMRMDQQLVRSPAQWLRDQNRKRLSYGDEHG